MTSKLSWTVDLRSALPPVGNQAGRPTCLSWATSAAHAQEVGELLSIEHLHWASGNCPSGRGRVSSVISVLRVVGQPPEDQWPYLDSVDEDSDSYGPPDAVRGPFAFGALSLSGCSVDALSGHLLANQTPVLLLRVTDAFIAAKGGVITLDGPGQDGHAVVAVGVVEYLGEKPVGPIEPGDRLVCLRNSWGRRWGLDGHALISEAALVECGIGAFVVSRTGTKIDER